MQHLITNVSYQKKKVLKGWYETSPNGVYLTLKLKNVDRIKTVKKKLFSLKGDIIRQKIKVNKREIMIT